MNDLGDVVFTSPALPNMDRRRRSGDISGGDRCRLVGCDIDPGDKRDPGVSRFELRGIVVGGIMETDSIEWWGVVNDAMQYFYLRPISQLFSPISGYTGTLP